MLEIDVVEQRGDAFRLASGKAQDDQRDQRQQNGEADAEHGQQLIEALRREPGAGGGQQRAQQQHRQRRGDEQAAEQSLFHAPSPMR